MTDLECFVELYRSFGIECKVNISIEGQVATQVIYIGYGVWGMYDVVTESPKFDGYYGFYSSVSFDMAGKFIGQGFWE